MNAYRLNCMHPMPQVERSPKLEQEFIENGLFAAFQPPSKKNTCAKSEFGWQVCSSLHKRIQWNVANLMNESEIERFSQSDIIFCRNVFIYFSPDSIRKTVGCFYENMPNRAYLFLGSSESLLKLNRDFDLREIGGAFVYVKEKIAKS